MTRNRPVAPVLALDIGNVCLRVELQDLLEAMGFANMDHVRDYDPEGRILAVCDGIECGTLSPSEFLNQFGSLLPEPQEPEAARQTWRKLIGHEIDGMADLVSEAAACGVQTVLMSDICAIHYELCRERISFFDQIAGAVLSYEAGALKPNAPMYEAMEQNYCGGRPPLLFTDDKEENVSAAWERDWPAHQFQGIDGFRDRLRHELAKLG